MTAFSVVEKERENKHGMFWNNSTEIEKRPEIGHFSRLSPGGHDSLPIRCMPTKGMDAAPGPLRRTAKPIYFWEGEAPAEPIFRGRSRFRASRLGGSLALPAFGEDFAVVL